MTPKEKQALDRYLTKSPEEAFSWKQVEEEVESPKEPKHVHTCQFCNHVWPCEIQSIDCPTPAIDVCMECEEALKPKEHKCNYCGHEWDDGKPIQRIEHCDACKTMIKGKNVYD